MHPDDVKRINGKCWLKAAGIALGAVALLFLLLLGCMILLFRGWDFAANWIGYALVNCGLLPPEWEGGTVLAVGIGLWLAGTAGIAKAMEWERRRRRGE